MKLANRSLGSRKLQSQFEGFESEHLYRLQRATWNAFPTYDNLLNGQWNIKCYVPSNTRWYDVRNQLQINNRSRIQNTISIAIAVSIATWKNQSNVEIAFQITVKCGLVNSKTFPMLPLRRKSVTFWIHATDGNATMTDRRFANFGGCERNLLQHSDEITCKIATTHLVVTMEI